MPLLPDPDDPRGDLLVDAGGRPLARTRLRDVEGVAGATTLMPGVAAADAGRQARLDLAGLRVATTDQGLADALLAAGSAPRRVAVTLTHDLAALPAALPLPAGWALAPGGWDADLAAAVAEAYGAGNVDGPWTAEDTEEIAGMHEPTASVPALAPATARVVDPAGRSAGQVVCAGPVPWVEQGAWVLTIGLADRARGLGLGRALLTRALHGTREAGLPCLGLSVTEGNPARRLYNAAGFRVVRRVVSVQLPGSD